jgi:hypothetical protein
VQITGLLPIERICHQQASEQALALDMDVLFLIQLLIFKRERGRMDLLMLFATYKCCCRHVNMDYSICNALQYGSGQLSQALVVYDIACQWSCHFKERVAQSSFLTLKEWRMFIAAVGKFHLSAHVPQCFPRFSLNFVHGTGQQDGEILETLWAEFNKVSTSARTMSKAHRTEVYDDHMLDSNWKKLIGMSEQAFFCHCFWGFY